jgi:hypothetical protein
MHSDAPRISHRTFQIKPVDTVIVSEITRRLCATRERHIKECRGIFYGSDSVTTFVLRLLNLMLENDTVVTIFSNVEQFVVDHLITVLRRIIPLDLGVWIGRTLPNDVYAWSFVLVLREAEQFS